MSNVKIPIFLEEDIKILEEIMLKNKKIKIESYP